MQIGLNNYIYYMSSVQRRREHQHKSILVEVTHGSTSTPVRHTGASPHSCQPAAGRARAGTYSHHELACSASSSNLSTVLSMLGGPLPNSGLHVPS